MSESYEVRTVSLNVHARTLDDLAAALGDALAAADVTIADDAYGQAGTRFASALGRVGRDGQATLRTGIGALDTAAKALRASAKDYDEQEAAGVTAYQGLEP